MASASQDDKVDVHKQLTDITEQWDALENAWSKRKSELEQTLEIATQYETELASIENWLTEEEAKFDNMPGMATNAGGVKKQLAEMRVNVFVVSFHHSWLFHCFLSRACALLLLSLTPLSCILAKFS